MEKTGRKNKGMTTSQSSESLRTLVSRLEKSAPLNAEKEATELRQRLLSLRQTLADSTLRWQETDRIFARAMFLVDTQLPLLGKSSFPVSRKTRQLVRGLQSLLSQLAEDLSDAGEANDKNAPPQELRLWRVL